MADVQRVYEKPIPPPITTRPKIGYLDGNWTLFFVVPIVGYLLVLGFNFTCTVVLPKFGLSPLMFALIIVVPGACLVLYNTFFPTNLTRLYLGFLLQVCCLISLCLQVYLHQLKPFVWWTVCCAISLVVSYIKIQGLKARLAAATMQKLH